MDAGNMLKPALARGELHCVGATTLDEYRKHIEKDAALERRFQTVLVDEPSVEDTIAILRGLKSVTRSTTRSRSPTRRSSRPRRSRTATSPTVSCRTRPSISSTRRRRASAWRSTQARGAGPARPADRAAQDGARGAQEGERRGVQEAAAGARCAAEGARARVFRPRGDLEGREGKVQGTAHIKEELERARLDFEAARRASDLGRMSELQYGKIPELEKRLKAAQEAERRRRRWCATR